MSDLDQLLGEFEARKRAEQQATESQRQLAEQQRQQAMRVLASVVQPTLVAVAENVRRWSHRAEVRIVGQDQPAVAFDMTIQLQGLSSTSILTFRHIESGIEVAKQVCGSNKAVYAPLVWPIEQISQQKVREEAVAFVAAVLQAN